MGIPNIKVGVTLSTKICNACNGKGTITVPGAKHVVKPEKDPWDEFEGRNYHERVCTKCNGTGEI